MLDILLFIWIAGMMIIITFHVCTIIISGGLHEYRLRSEFLNGKTTRKQRIFTGIALIPLWFITFPLAIWAFNYLKKENQ